MAAMVPVRCNRPAYILGPVYQYLLLHLLCTASPSLQVHLSERRSCRRLCVRRIAKQDFELHGRRIAKGSSIYVSSLYAKASDSRVSAGDHVCAPTPAHMDMRDLAVSFKPERWLGGELDKKAALATFGMGAHFCLGYPLYMQVMHEPPVWLSMHAGAGVMLLQEEAAQQVPQCCGH